MKKKIEKAIVDFSNGIRPEGYKPAKYWHVVGKDGALYPAKAIWSLATGVYPANFNTKDATEGLLDNEYSLVDTRVVNTQVDLSEAIEQSAKDTSDNRRKRLKNAPKKPEGYLAVSNVYRRNPDVVAEVLDRAKGICEKCKNPAPFNKKSDGKPYLEVHHTIPLSDGGDDTVENAIALCPNCHRMEHFG